MDDIMNMVGTTTAITIGFSILVTVVILFFVLRMVSRVMGSVNSSLQNSASVLATGDPAEATILQIMDTGTRVNDNPMIQILMEVQPRMGNPYQAQVRTFVPLIKMAQVQPGLKVNVKIDRANPNNVALELR